MVTIWNFLKPSKLYTYNGWVVWCIKYTSLRLLKMKKSLLISKHHLFYYFFFSWSLTTLFNFFIFIFFPFIFISWRLFTLQYCSGFCHTLTWISLGYTCIPHPDPHSHLPLYPIPLGLPSAPGPSTCLMHPTWAGALSKHYLNRSEKWDICNVRQNELAIPIFQIFLIQMSNTNSMTIQLFNPFVFIFNIKNLSYNPPGYKISLPFTLYFWFKIF